MRNLYATVAAAAAEQWGVVTWGQLRAAGLAASTLVRWARAERLHRIHRGVYSLVPPGALAPQGRWLAGVLAAGPGAALSHRSAAVHWDLLDDQLRLPEVTVPIDGARSVRGV